MVPLNLHTSFPYKDIGANGSLDSGACSARLAEAEGAFPAGDQDDRAAWEHL